MTILVILTVLFLDQLSKALVTKLLSLNQSIPVFQGIFHLTLVHNRGAAFGILKGRISLFILISLVAITMVYFHLKKNRDKKNLLYDFSLSLILAGGMGNLIDRVFWGHVIDFLDFRIWPVFNIADSAITIGAVLLGWQVLRSGKQLTR